MRAMWSGSLSFGLVNIPVRLFSATREEALNFDLLHEKDKSRIRYAKVCRHEEREVPNEEIVRGYEYRKGHYVVLNDEDFEKANPRRTRAVEILDFVQEEEIDSIYFEKPYYLEPDRGSDRAYALLREALKKTNKVGIARYVIRNREHLGVIRPSGDVLVLNQIRYKSEVREAEGLNLPEAEMVEARELDMALSLIDQLTKKFEPEEYRDTYVDDLMRLIEQKAQGKEPEAVAEEPAPTEVVDLMAVLKASLDRAKEEAAA